jgi:hypothetical protein
MDPSNDSSIAIDSIRTDESVTEELLIESLKTTVISVCVIGIWEVRSSGEIEYTEKVEVDVVEEPEIAVDEAGTDSTVCSEVVKEDE